MVSPRSRNAVDHVTTHGFTHVYYANTQQLFHLLKHTLSHTHMSAVFTPDQCYLKTPRGQYSAVLPFMFA